MHYFCCIWGPTGVSAGPLALCEHINCVAYLGFSGGAMLTMYTDDIHLWKPINKYSNDFVDLERHNAICISGL